MRLRDLGLMTEFDSPSERGPGAGWILYDGDCGICMKLMRAINPGMTRRGFRFAPLQADWVRARLNLSEEALLAEMRVITPEDRVVGGADSVVWLARRVWWTWPMWAMSFLPGFMPAMRAGYRWFARNRHRFGSACSVNQAPRPAPPGGGTASGGSERIE